MDAATLPRTRALLRVARRLLLVVGLMVGFLLLGFATGIAHADSNPVEKVTSAAEKTVKSVTGSGKSDSAKSSESSSGKTSDSKSSIEVAFGVVVEGRLEVVVEVRDLEVRDGGFVEAVDQHLDEVPVEANPPVVDSEAPGSRRCQPRRRAAAAKAPAVKAPAAKAPAAKTPAAKVPAVKTPVVKAPAANDEPS